MSETPELDEDLILEQEEEGPFCVCDEQPVEDELASNVCSACGKLLT